MLLVIGPKQTRAVKVAVAQVRKHLKAIGAGVSGVKKLSNVSVKEMRGLRGAVILGTAQTNPILRDLADKKLITLNESSPGEEGFVLKQVRYHRNPFLVMAGYDSLGLLYATDEFSERVKKRGDMASLDVAECPRFKLRAHRMDLPEDDEFIIKRRINAVYLPAWHYLGVSFAGKYAGLEVMSEFLGKGTRRKKEIEWMGLDKPQVRGRGKFSQPFGGQSRKKYSSYRKRLQELRELGLRIFLTHYEWAFPIPTLAHGHFKRQTVRRGKICLSQPLTRKIIRRTYQKTFELFPELSGVVFFLSNEGGVALCNCSACRKAYQQFKEKHPEVTEMKPTRPDGIDYFISNQMVSDLIYETVKGIGPSLEVIRNTWDFAAHRGKECPRLAHEFNPTDVIFQPYPQTDTNLREDYNPNILWWAEQGRRVVPKQCDLMEAFPRLNCFPNAFPERLQTFYKRWARAGVYGVGLNGGWYVRERFEHYQRLEQNIGFGLNFYVHWKLLWNPNRKDVAALWNEWISNTYGPGTIAVVKKCLKNAGRIYQIDPKVPPFGEDDRDLHSPLTMDNILLNNKFYGNHISRPDTLDQEFVKRKKELPAFWRRLSKVFSLLDENIMSLERAMRTNRNEKLVRLCEWFKSEKGYLQGIEQLYRAQELYFFEKDRARAALFYAKAHERLGESLLQWREIALKCEVWSFLSGGKWSTRYGTSITRWDWLHTGGFKVFFERIRQRAEQCDVTDDEFDSFPTLSTPRLGANQLEKLYAIEKDYSLLTKEY